MLSLLDLGFLVAAGVYVAVVQAFVKWLIPETGDGSPVPDHQKSAGP